MTRNNTDRRKLKADKLVFKGCVFLWLCRGTCCGIHDGMGLVGLQCVLSCGNGVSSMLARGACKQGIEHYLMPHVFGDALLWRVPCAFWCMCVGLARFPCSWVENHVGSSCRGDSYWGSARKILSSHTSVGLSIWQLVPDRVSGGTSCFRPGLPAQMNSPTKAVIDGASLLNWHCHFKLEFHTVCKGG
eukprot:6944-Amphidinium_carterae.1